ncbi:DUF6653 family protein [uncultured Roseibium sp.]|uniref:DUF6653 family protein n=1 Tax=uncultured Roseibium sp. TaxID=1936171 RepID=UPI0026293274|nr:DUF6653 family protein [uncultured Roseibium sp.]
MQSKQRHQYPNVQPARFSSYPANSAMLHLHPVGRSPNGALATYLKIVAPGLLAAALWSHIWWGLLTAALLTIGLSIGLVALQRLRIGNYGSLSWARTIGFGERIWLNRIFVPVPEQLGARITTLYVVFWLGAAIALLGGATASGLLTASGLVVAFCAQLVCFRNLVELFHQMKSKTPLYHFWSTAPVNDNTKPVRTELTRA